MLRSQVKVGTVKPRHDIADILRKYGKAYRCRYPVTWQQGKVMEAISHCRTATLGGYVEECDECGRLRMQYCSCKNRHGVKCGAFEKAQWLTRQKRKLLPMDYLHVVFTLERCRRLLGESGELGEAAEMTFGEWVKSFLADAQSRTGFLRQHHDRRGRFN